MDRARVPDGTCMALASDGNVIARMHSRSRASGYNARLPWFLIIPARLNSKSAAQRIVTSSAVASSVFARGRVQRRVAGAVGRGQRRRQPPRGSVLAVVVDDVGSFLPFRVVSAFNVVVSVYVRLLLPRRYAVASDAS